MIGIAIRACFGKPAFEIMQQGHTPAGMKNEAFPEKTMILGLFRKKNNNQAIVDRQYAALAAAARMPELYERLNVPDTVMGRFEMLSIAMILFFAAPVLPPPAARRSPRRSSTPSSRISTIRSANSASATTACRSA